MRVRGRENDGFGLDCRQARGELLADGDVEGIGWECEVAGYEHGVMGRIADGPGGDGDGIQRGLTDARVLLTLDQSGAGWGDVASCRTDEYHN